MAGQKRAATQSAAPRLVGVAGLGSMGAAIAGRLLDTGFEVCVTNRTPSKAEPLVGAGANWAMTPAELASRVPVVITMVSDDAALEQVMTGVRGILAGARPGLVCADMSTVSPGVSARMGAACAGAGVAFLRAPVSGGPTLAAAGKLGALVSGPPEVRTQLKGLLDALSKSVFYLGPGEEARVMKLALNMVIGATVVGLSEALVLGEQWGLDWACMLDVITDSAVASPFVRYKAPLLAEREFPAAFSTALLAKDLRLAIDLGREARAQMPVTERVRGVVEDAIAAGLGDLDAVSVVLLFERLVGSREGVPVSPPAVEVDG